MQLGLQEVLFVLRILERVGSFGIQGLGILGVRFRSEGAVSSVAVNFGRWGLGMRVHRATGGMWFNKAPSKIRTIVPP